MSKSDCTPEFWQLKDIRDSLEKEWNGDKKIVIPMFQRGKRWDENKKETFIDSLRKKYPIGTLLFYKTVEKEGNETVQVYTLIDGLQRGTTIKEYLSNPSKFFSIEELSQETMEKVYSLIVSGGDENAQKQKVNEIICEYIHNLKNYEFLEIYELYDLLQSEFPVLQGKTREFGDVIKEDFKMLKDDYNSLCSMSIPAIVYTGDENTLPEIFERINSKGVALTEYEIYAASWSRQEFVISNSEIIEWVLKKYDLFNDGEYNISGYNRDEKRKNRTVNAFEYVFGLSKYLQNKYESLAFYKNLKDDETNPVAFQLLNACFNTSHSQIKDVHKIITKFANAGKIDLLENALINSIEFVNKCIAPILKFKGNNRSKTKIFHSQYQIMSLIAYSFRKKYDINSTDLKVLDTWNESKQILLKNIWKYYIYDIIIKYWSDGGTGKIHTSNSEDRYFTDLSLSQFSVAYDSYVEGMYSRHEAKNVAYPSDADYVILNTIYVNTFSAMDQLSIDKFDVEHIATKDQMKKLNKICQGDGLPISHLANLCYLPEFENRSKGHNNFYQDTNYLKKSNTTLETIETKYSFTQREDLEWMDISYTKEDFETLKDYYINEFLKNRNEILKKAFLESLGYKPNEPIETKQNNVEVQNDFNEQFFRLTKIGNMVKQSFDYLFRNDSISDTDITNLSDQQYSLEKLGCAYPVLVSSESDVYDDLGRRRYYKESFRYKDKDYYLCSQWFEHDRKLVVPWIKDRLPKQE